MMLGQTILMLTKDEGYSSTVYKDTLGNFTIGYGFTHLTQPEAYHILVGRVDGLITELQKELPVFNTLDDVRKSAIIQMSFNLGLHGLQEFRTMIACLDKQDWADAANAMRNSLWARQVGNRAEKLSLMVETGSWPS